MNIIKNLRKQKKITQQKLSEILGVGRTTITMYEQDKIVPPADVLIKLADYFNVSVDFILGYEKPYQINYDFQSTGLSMPPMELKSEEIKKDLTDESMKSINELFLANGITPEKLNALPESKKTLIMNLIKEITEKQ